jgi:drug/metabolite transporter (DMT)-like permease
MSYVIMTLTVLCGCIKGGCGKKISGYADTNDKAVLFNSIRMLLCIAIGAVMVLAQGDGFAVSLGMLGVSTLGGLCNAVFLICWLFAVQKNRLVTVDVALMLGAIIPSVLCAVCFGQALSAWKMVGFSVLLAATAVLAGKSHSKGLLFMALAAVGEGMVGFAQQMYIAWYGNTYALPVYHFYVYVFTAAALLISYTFLRRPEPVSLKKPLPFLAIMAVCLFAAGYLQTVATARYNVSAQVLYPVLKGGSLIATNLMAALFFKEKMTARTLLGTAIAVVGIILMGVMI